MPIEYPPYTLFPYTTLFRSGVTFTVPASATLNFRLSNLRGNITQAGGGFQQPILAVLSVNGIPSPLIGNRSEEHTSELQSHHDLVCRLLLVKKKSDD